MKKVIKTLVFIGLLIGSMQVPIMVVLATDNGITDDALKTEVGIGFKESETLEPPTVIEPISKPLTPITKPKGQLPHTGELLTSLIMLLFGLSILIVFVGAANLKRIYYIEVLE